MRILVAVANLAMGTAYIGIGALAFVDLARHRRDARSEGHARPRPVDHFGLAVVGLAFTCGPHHFDHGLHVALGNQRADALDLLTVAVGLPVGWAFAALRVEGFRGGRGERIVAGTPDWLALTPAAIGTYAAVLAAAAETAHRSTFGLSAAAVPNGLLVVLYLAIATIVLRGQLGNHAVTGEWSLSGLSLMGIFATCAPMHAVTFFDAATGRTGFELHGFLADWASVPVAAYFLWTSLGLQRGWLVPADRSSQSGAVALAPVPVEVV